MFVASIFVLAAAGAVAAQTGKKVAAPPAAPPAAPADGAGRWVPFFPTDYTVLDLEIGTADTGIVQDTQHVIEPDNKWVGYSTAGQAEAGIGMDVLEEFSFDRLPPMGYVGTPMNRSEAQPGDRQAGGRGMHGGAGGKPATRPVAEPRGVLAETGTIKLLDLAPRDPAGARP